MLEAYQNPKGPGEGKLYAVLTGDIVGSSSLPGSGRQHFLQSLKSILDEIVAHDSMTDAFYGRFEIFRGDSFQGIFIRPAEALRAAIIIRAAIRSMRVLDATHARLDARIAVGLGKVDYLPEETSISEGDGEAYRLSGRTLDMMKRDERLAIITPWPEVNMELHTECALLDALIGKWTIEQAEAISRHLKRYKQREIADNLGISQPAAALRLKSAGSRAVERFCERYEQVLKDKYSS